MTDLTEQFIETQKRAEAMTAGRAGWDRSEYGDGGFASGFFGSRESGERWAAWHGEGTLLDKPAVSAQEAITLSGQDWRVRREPVCLPDGREVPGFVANVRDDTGDALGVVGAGFQLVQNEEAYAFMDELQGAPVLYHACTVLRGGRTVTLLAEIDKDVRIAGLDTERVKAYIALVNSHYGGSFNCGATPVRIACTNTTQLFLDTAPRLITLRHTSGIRERLRNAREVLEMSFAYYDELEALGSRLVAEKMTRGEFGAFLDRLVPLEPRHAESDRAARNRGEAMSAIMRTFQESPNLAEVRGSRWGALQAVAEWHQWERRSTSESGRYSRLHEPQPIIDRAARLLAV